MAKFNGTTTPEYHEELRELPLSTTAQIEDIETFDKMAQFIGIIKVVKSPATSANGKTQYMKGTIATEHDILPFICFNETIKVHENKLQPGVKCLFTNCYIKPFEKKYDPTVTVDWQVNFMVNSEIKWIQKLDKDENDANKTFKKCDLEDVCKYEGCIEITNAFLRSLPTTFKESSTSSIRICSVTDGRTSLEVRLLFDDNVDLKIGEAIAVKGILSSTSNPPYMAVEKSDCFFKKNDIDPIPLAQTIAATKGVKRKSEHFNEVPPPTKLPRKDA